MSRRKVFTYLLGVSFVAGVAREALRKKSTKTLSHESPAISNFVGTWGFDDPLYPGSKTLKIDDQARLFINEKPVKGSLILLNQHNLIFTDHYGYELVIQPIDNNTLTLFDSADDKTYTLFSTSFNQP
ncbi:DUF4828 domain-containing protein [Desemzia sp. RIT804]|uniref:DUF4828 domain-containing protein n=1 Tax=Desemzia sp. RIT 804 TaxID=2810209 RepID=UPI00194E322C|nr:DUF4828 domain-containing protein [Desemzia sp. RIT 804]MBM6614448.1 DUF4828 domain-containing protein [Desemzia sp. RIT 804]